MCHYFRVSKNVMDKGGGVSRLSVNILLSHSAKKIRSGTLLCFTLFRVSKNLMPKRGTSRISVEKILSHSAENFPIGTF